MKKRFAEKSIITVLSAICIISIINVVGMYSRYLQIDKSNSFSVSAYANYNLTVNANGGKFTDLREDDEIWHDVTTDSATRTIEVGEKYGSIPNVELEGYTLGGWSALPTDYREIEYLVTHGNAYIDTEISPEIDYQYYVKAMGPDNQWLLSSRDETYQGVNIMTDHFDFFGNQPLRFDCKDKDTSIPFEVSIVNRTLTITQSEKGFIVTHTFSGASTSYGTKRSLYLFGVNAKKPPTSPYADDGVRIYKATIKDKNGKKILDMIPMERVSDHKCGMYDTVSGRFFEKKGSGPDFSGGPYTEEEGVIITPDDVFTAAQDQTLYAVWLRNCRITLDANGGTGVPEYVTIPQGRPFLDYIKDEPEKEGYTFKGWKKDTLPSELEQLEYITSDGIAYLDTGVATNVDYEYSVKAKGPKESFIMGSRPSAYYGVNFMNIYIDFYGTGDAQRFKLEPENKFSADSVYTFSIKDRKLTIVQDGNTIVQSRAYTSITESSGTNRPVYVFATNDPGEIKRCKNGLSIYGAYIKDKDGNELLNLIPCRKKLAGEGYEYGMYDTVSEQFLSSPGLSGDERREGGSIITPETLVEDDCVIYAIWEPVNYILRLNSITGSQLPDEYQEVDYIESTGEQYIDTGLKPDANFAYSIAFSHNETSTWITGSVVSGGVSNDIGISRDAIRFGTQYKKITPFVNGVKNEVYVDKTGYELNGTKVDWDAVSNLSVGDSVYLFYAHNSSAGKGGRIYSYKTYENGELKHEFVPCYEKSDTKNAGMYDLIGKSFYANAGTGEFVIGNDVHVYEAYDQILTYDKPEPILDNPFEKPGYTIIAWNTAADGRGESFAPGETVVNLANTGDAVVNLYAQWHCYGYRVNYLGNTMELPKGYAEMEFLESTNGQYIDTGVIPSVNYRIEIDFQYNSDGGWIIGSVHNKGLLDDIGIAVKAIRFGTRYTETVDFSDKLRHKVSFDKKGYTLDGERVDWSAESEMDIKDKPMYAFFANGSGASKGGRIYYIKIYDGETLIHYFVPCVFMNENVSGLYDIIGESFCKNAVDGISDFSHPDPNCYFKDYTFGTGQKLDENTFERDGYEFTGWNTEPDGTGKSYAEKDDADSLELEGTTIDLYAQWKKTAALTLNLNYGGNRSPETVINTKEP